ncbi:hypothetical protein OG205_22660 [Lentzea sp. NBC_00516]|uniref:hypothetical protein n=1 Tax=Lentzea sp. NBC_00516 TaxID=2903582 RepID=UPI002E820BB1|nr:hypothetical protein [Lentzea sp. NBC_00516]WUD20957.1 hypothetical protein OG205_22660 [Lentzea sp. NBC_00516]
MTASQKSRRARTALAACLLAFPLAAAGSADATEEVSLVGRWEVMVTVHNGVPPQRGPMTCDFTPDHRLDCMTGPGAPPQKGDGIWTQTGRGTISFWITHPEPNGSINATHLGKVTRTRFTTKAVAYVHLPDGTPLIGPVQVEAEATRLY